MDNYLNLRANQVLYFEPDGLSKVRFAKILYFLHKGLVQKKLATIAQMRFIRMPLGPVPVGFKHLAKNPDFTISEISQSLSYNTELYTLKNGHRSLQNNDLKIVKEIVEALRSLATSFLVAESHKEPSWLNHSNGTEYELTLDDINRPLPKSNRSPISSEIDNQYLQARLVEGMLDDIVEESTSLEYPQKEN